MNLSLDKNCLKNSVQILNQYLADVYSLYLKTHLFHWNVTGLSFYSLHKLFDDQYSALYESVDEIAERIRSLDSFVVASFSEFQKTTCLKEAPKKLDAVSMVSHLLKDHEKIIEHMRQWVLELGEWNDKATEDYFIGRLAEHEKMAWMLRAHKE
jgi:starvation-inducible DNA-binding protein